VRRATAKNCPGGSLRATAPGETEQAAGNRLRTPARARKRSRGLSPASPAVGPFGVAMTVLLLVALLGCGSSNAPAAPAAAVPAPPTAVKVITVEASEATDVVEASGVVEVIDSVMVLPETAGVVTEVLFADGASVVRGQKLARLRDADARAAVDEAQARLGLAQLALDRLGSLKETEQVAKVELDRARAERDLAQAQLDRAREALRRTTIVAPFAGVTGRREITVGQVVTPTTPVTRIEHLDPVTVDVALPESAVASVRTGQLAEVEVGALPGVPFTGELSYLAPRASSAARTLAARVRVPNPDGALRPGLTAAVRITTGVVPDAVVVPTYAVVQSANGASAWVVDAEGKAQPRALTLGRRGPDTIRVLAGIAVGDRLVVEGFTRLRPGSAVEIQTADPNASGAAPGAPAAPSGPAPAGAAAPPAAKAP